MWEPETVALVLAAFFLAGSIKGLLGMGLPLVTLAVLASTLGVRETLSVMLIPGIVSNAWQALAGPSFRPLLRRLWLFLAAACLGIWFGTSILATARSETLVAIVGVTLTLYAAVALLRVEMPPPGRHEPWMSPLMGGLGGVMFGMAGNMIVPGILYLNALRLPRDTFVQALGITFITITLALGASLTSRGLMTVDLGLMSALALVPMGLGLALGTRYRHHISEARFRRLFLLGLVLIGLDMLRRALL